MPPTTSPYYPVLDFARIAAAIGVVWIHVAGGEELRWTKEFGRFAVPFFACSAVYLAYGSLARHPQTTVGTYFVSRVVRVYLPFLVWSVFYLIFRNCSSLFIEHTGAIKPSLAEFFWNGVAIQLWFLPFILAMTCFTFLMAKLVRTVPWTRWPLAAAFGVAAVCTAQGSPSPWVGRFGYGVSLGYEALPACAAALALAIMEGSAPVSGAPPRVRFTVSTVGQLMLTVWLAGVFLRVSGNGLANLAGFALLLVSLSWPTQSRVEMAARLAATAFGIYLVHPVFVEGLQHILPKFGFHNQTPSLEVVIFVLSVVMSCLSIVALRVSKRTRWLTG